MRSARGHSGLGVTALAANGDRVIVGSRAFLLQEKVSVAIADARTSALEGTETAFMAAAMEQAVGELRNQERAMKARAVRFSGSFIVVPLAIQLGPDLPKSVRKE